MKTTATTPAPTLRMPLLLAAALLFLAGCAPQTYTLQSRKAALTTIDSTQQANAAIDQFVQPYKTAIDKEMGVVVATTARVIEKTDREKPGSQGPIGIFAADVLLRHGRNTLDPALQISLINQGGLRVPLPKGPITVGKIYEVMPFDNMVATAEISAAQLDSIVQMIVTGKDAVLGGVKIQAEKGVAQVWVNGKPVKPTDTFKLISIDYLLTGGSNMRFLKTAKQVNTGIFLRDFLIAYCKAETQAGRQLDFVQDDRLQITK
jgi:2',3'-cyclic-nucleotide 2'-phosphodiesterase (5'-nucleotidase family)